MRKLIAFIHPRLAVVLHDLGMVWLAWMATNWLRYSFEPNPPALAWLSPEVGLVLLAQGLVLWWTGLYKGLWRFASLPDLWNIIRACLTPIRHYVARKCMAYRCSAPSNICRNSRAKSQRKCC